MKPSTYFGLLAEFGTAHIPITEVGTKYFGHDDKTAKQYASKAKYPFSVFQCGSKWIVDAGVFAEYLDKLKEKAEKEFRLTR
ncbi:MAG: pyocin activator PrtN family protein [Methylobacter sp.]